MTSLERKPIIVACFSRRPERPLFESLVHPELPLAFSDERASVVDDVLTWSPAAVVLPASDADGIPCAPLIARLRHEAPDVPICVLASSLRVSPGLAESIRAGGTFAMCDDATELRALLVRLSATGTLSDGEYEAARALVAALGPPALVDFLLECVRFAPCRGTVSDCAVAIGLTPHTMRRHARAAGWPSPARMIEWGRLLHASVLLWRTSSSLTTLAQASGFRSVPSLHGAAKRLLGLEELSADDLSPLAVSIAFRRCVTRRLDG